MQEVNILLLLPQKEKELFIMNTSQLDKYRPFEEKFIVCNIYNKRWPIKRVKKVIKEIIPFVKVITIFKKKQN